MSEIYTTGYLKRRWTPKKLLAVAEERNAIVLDIRYNPWSNNPDWQFHNLQQVMGRSYEWCQSLGNVNYRSGPIKIFAPTSGILTVKQILRVGRRSIILLCACRDYGTCHRRHVVKMIRQDLGVGATELNPPGFVEQLSLWGEA